MVLRKPYGFLIKYFKLIHLIIFGLLFYINSKCRSLYKFIISCINNVSNKYDAGLYIDKSIYLLIIISCILMFIIYWLLKYKNKPRKYYVIGIVGYIIIGIFISITYGYIGSFDNDSIDQKTIRMYRDILLIVNCFQYLLMIFTLIRGLGFDIKKFDFARDVQELNLNNSDDEEVEVNLQLNTNNVMTYARKKKRELGYYYKEYKVIILIIIFVIVLVLGYGGYKFLSVKLKVYDQNESFGNNHYVMITDSYYVIGKDTNYVIVSARLGSSSKEKFNINSLKLLVDENEYVPNKSICSKFGKLGYCYKQQYIDNKLNDYLFVYEVDNLNINKSYIVYNEDFEKSFKVKLNMNLYENE